MVTGLHSPGTDRAADLSRGRRLIISEVVRRVSYLEICTLVPRHGQSGFDQRDRLSSKSPSLISTCQHRCVM